MNHKKIGKMSERISKSKPFIDEYNWKEINHHQSGKDDSKIFDKNNPNNRVCFEQEVP